ncbi:MAG TPA: hypothetical protein DIT50_01775, partial [Rhodocyclaceae bacterium]|nr:hypothetical protein [Rhodocyclaceae bacterium]
MCGFWVRVPTGWRGRLGRTRRGLVPLRRWVGWAGHEDAQPQQASWGCRSAKRSARPEQTKRRSGTRGVWHSLGQRGAGTVNDETRTIVPDGADRATIRRHFLRLRRALSPENWQARNAALCGHLAQWWTQWRARHAPRWVGLYWPMKGEPDVRSVFAAWQWRALPAAVAPH